MLIFDQIKSNQMPKLTNKSTFDIFIDDEYQSKKFVKNIEREGASIPFSSVDNFKVFNRAILNDNNLNPLFKKLFK
jgi:hypothetical protein